MTNQKRVNTMMRAFVFLCAITITALSTALATSNNHREALIKPAGKYLAHSAVKLSSEEITKAFSEVHDEAEVQDNAGTRAVNTWYADGRFTSDWSIATGSGTVKGRWWAEDNQRCVVIYDGLPDRASEKRCGPIYRQGNTYVSVNEDGSIHGIHTLSPVSVPSQAIVRASALKLQRAWSDLLEGLKNAEQALLEEQHFPPAASERVLADGYRYMLAHLNREIELAIRADPNFPEFFRSMDMLRKWTGENPDAMYLKAPIDASGYYEVDIKTLNTQEWGNGGAEVLGRKAPRLVTFQTITGVPGYTGELEEMGNCTNQTLDSINGLSLEADREGHYRILIGPQTPEGYSGNFLFSSKELQCPSTGVSAVANATALSVREIFSDWANEVPLELSITRQDSVGLNRPPLNVSQLAEIISTLGERVQSQIRFWNLLMEFPLEMTGDRNADGKRALPVNGINQPAPPFTAGGVAGARQLYAAGIFELAVDEALVIKMTAPVEPYYVGFQLNNLWMEGPDQQNFVSSLSGAQNPVVGDATRYYIIAESDPGVQGWIDTTGLRRGFHAMRFVFEEDPVDKLLPVLEASLVRLDELDTVLPQNYPLIGEAERRAEVAVRQKHIKMRWRNY